MYVENLGLVHEISWRRDQIDGRLQCKGQYAEVGSCWWSFQRAHLAGKSLKVETALQNGLQSAATVHCNYP